MTVDSGTNSSSNDSSKIRFGKIIIFFHAKGYGFLAESVTDPNGKQYIKQHFFHLVSCNFEPRNGMVVQFQMGQGRKGPAAINVQSYSPPAVVAEIPGLDALAGETSAEVK